MAKEDRSSLVAYTFSLDECYGDGDDDWLTDPVYFLPLAEAPRYTSWDNELTICGLLLERYRNEHIARRLFQRVGFVVVSITDGNVAGSDYFVDEWKPPPWRAEELELVVVV